MILVQYFMNAYSIFYTQFYNISLIYFFQMDLTPVETLLKHINFYDTSFFIAVMAIIFNPLFWNVVRLAFMKWLFHYYGFFIIF